MLKLTLMLDLGLVDEPKNITRTWIGRWIDFEDGPRKGLLEEDAQAKPQN
jgi:hypothetical protein